MYCECDYEPSTVWNEKRLTARSLHCCTECVSAIKPGEAYMRIGSLYDGSWTTYKVCARCLACIDYVKAHVPCFCWAAEDLYGQAASEGGIDEVIRRVQHEVPGMGMEYGRLRVAVRRAESFKSAKGASMSHISQADDFRDLSDTGSRP